MATGYLDVMASNGMVGHAHSQQPTKCLATFAVRLTALLAASNNAAAQQPTCCFPSPLRPSVVVVASSLILLSSLFLTFLSSALFHCCVGCFKSSLCHSMMNTQLMLVPAILPLGDILLCPCFVSRAGWAELWCPQTLSQQQEPGRSQPTSSLRHPVVK